MVFIASIETIEVTFFHLTSSTFNVFWKLNIFCSSLLLQTENGNSWWWDQSQMRKKSKQSICLRSGSKSEAEIQPAVRCTEMCSALQWELRFSVLPLYLKNILTFEDRVRCVEQSRLEPTPTPYKNSALCTNPEQTFTAFTFSSMPWNLPGLQPAQ